MLAEGMAGSKQQAAFGSSISRFRAGTGKTASDLIHEGKADQVFAYLEAVRSGVYA